MRLQEEFTRRCETTSHIQYMQDYNLLTEMCGSDDLAKTGEGSGAFASESTELDIEKIKKLAENMLSGLLADTPRFHNFWDESQRVRRRGPQTGPHCLDTVSREGFVYLQSHNVRAGCEQ